MEGARANIEGAGLKFEALFTTKDLGQFISGKRDQKPFLEEAIAQAENLSAS